MADKYYLGVDIGSVSSNFVIINGQGQLADKLYLRTQGNPMKAIIEGLTHLQNQASALKIAGVGTTGSGRHLAGVMLGSDIVKNEVTAHAVAALHQMPEVKTIIEIGGQDSKIIIIRDQVVVDFAMNTVCAAGTGSFLDQQAQRLGVAIEDFGSVALQAVSPVRVAGRCGVFAESDMIHKQQLGHPLPDIIAGLCQALARNYLTNVGKGKDIQAPIVFQGGVAANAGLVEAFARLLGVRPVVPDNFEVMGAVGAALLAQETAGAGKVTGFKGYEYINQGSYQTRSIDCSGCPNQCEVVCIKRNDKPIAYWGDRCRRYEVKLSQRTQTAG
ncbi:MAG: acyl-CoA dehydratase activase [Methylocystaceae bacterium]